MARGISTARGISKTDVYNLILDRLGNLKLVVLTQAEYDALSTKDANTLYFITE